MALSISAETLARMWPDCPAATRNAVVEQLPAVCAKRGITSTLVLAHFLAQISHESGGGTIGRESMRYKAKRIIEIFGKGHHSAAVSMIEAQSLALDAKKTGGVALANRVYGLGNPSKAAELGNIEANDGWDYRGGGFSQTTGRDAYARMSKVAGIDLVTDPDRISDPAIALDVAAADFASCSRDGKTCVEWAGEDNVLMVTKALNGGTNGLNDRRDWLARWKIALQNEASPETVANSPLQLGGRGWRVGALQRRLKELGYPVGNIDEKFGVETKKAVILFQTDNDLPLTGAVDPATQAALDSASPREVSAARACATATDVAGLPTVQAAMTTAKMAKSTGLLAVVAGGVDAAKDDPLAAVQQGVDKMQQAKGVIDHFTALTGGMVDWAVAHPTVCLSLAVVAVSLVLVTRANGTVAAVVERYRTGHDMG